MFLGQAVILFAQTLLQTFIWLAFILKFFKPYTIYYISEPEGHLQFQDARFSPRSWVSGQVYSHLLGKGSSFFEEDIGVPSLLLYQ